MINLTNSPELQKEDIIDSLRKVEQAAFGFDDGSPVRLNFSDLRITVSVLQNLILEHHAAMQLVAKCGSTFRRYEANHRAKAEGYAGAPVAAAASLEKADYNAQLAQECEDLLAKTLEKTS